MKNRWKITIVTPVLNAEKDIEQCLRSVAGQTYGNKEHLIVDGCSTDGTLGIVKRYAEEYPHIRYVSEKDSGIYDAMNKSIDLASGDWLYFLGSDDLFYNDAVLEQIFSTEALDAFEVVYGNVLWGDTGKVYDGKFSLLKLMDKNICHQAMFFRRELFNTIGRFDTKYKTWADYLFNIKCFAAGTVRLRYVDTIVAIYGINGLSSQMEDPDFQGNREALFKENFPTEYIAIKEQVHGLMVDVNLKSHQLAERDQQLAERNNRIAELQARLDELGLEFNNALDTLHASLSWRITAPLRNSGIFVQQSKRNLGLLVDDTKDKLLKTRELSGLTLAELGQFMKAKRRVPGKEELRLIIRNSLESFQKKHSSVVEPYESWCEVNAWNATREKLLRRQLEVMAVSPLISIIMPVYNPPKEYFDKALESVVGQVYENWELCIADDASTDPAVRGMLEQWSERDRRIRVSWRAENGNISLATNSAAEMANGDYLLLMDQDDELSPDALAEVALFVVEQPHTDILYSDDDKVDASGRRFDPQFKPDWSPELLLNYMYFSHLFVVRKSLYQAVGGMRTGFEGSQDYDFALRASELAQYVGHIPKILYHWRVLPGSTAASGDAKPASFEAGRKAVQEALERRNVPAVVYQPDWALAAKCGIFAHQFPDTGPSVAIIIPTKNKVEILAQCLRSIKEKTTYRNYRIVVVDNESDDSATLDYLKDLPDTVLRIESPHGRFNYAAINNRAVESVAADYVLFLNNDTEVITPQWLSQMVGYLGFSGVAAVGAKLVFPDGRLQHAGIVHGYYDGLAGPAFKLLPSWHGGYLSYTKAVRNYSAVTAACLLTRRDVFLGLGGFDEKTFSVAYNDVDYCYRLRAHDYRIVYCPSAELVHYENYSRGGTDNPAEVGAFKARYRQWRDPYYNPNLSLDNEQFQVAGRTVAPCAVPPIKTLMCAFNLNLEGAPYSQYELTVFLKKAKIVEPVVFCPTDGPLRAKYEDAGIPVVVSSHPLRGKHSLPEYTEGIRQFAARMQEMGVELVYGNTLQTFYAIDAAREAGLPSIWNPRESEPWRTYFDFMGPDIARQALECFRYPYQVVFVANATRALYAPLNTRNNFTTVHNGLNLERLNESLGRWQRAAARKELQVADDEVMVLLLGTVCERKGQLDLVKAVDCLDGVTASKIKVFIVGDRSSEYSRKMRSSCQALPESRRERVEILPETDDTALYYAAADIFVCSSRIESYPRVILEAMACGLPIVTTPVFGIVEQVQNGVNGIYYNPGDAQTLADALSRLVNDAEARSAMAANSGHVLASLNDFESMATAYGRIFREAWLSGGPRACAE